MLKDRGRLVICHAASRQAVNELHRTLRLAIMMLATPLVPLTTHPSRLMSSLVALRLPFFLVLSGLEDRNAPG